MSSGQHDHDHLDGHPRPDGSVIVPAALVRPLRAILSGYVAGCARDGAVPTPALRRLMWALASASQHTDPRPGSATGTTPGGGRIVEISTTDAAALLGCSVEYVRRLCRTGGVNAHRAGRRAWLIDRASLDAWRYGRNPR